EGVADVVEGVLEEAIQLRIVVGHVHGIAHEAPRRVLEPGLQRVESCPIRVGECRWHGGIPSGVMLAGPKPPRPSAGGQCDVFLRSVSRKMGKKLANCCGAETAETASGVPGHAAVQGHPTPFLQPGEQRRRLRPRPRPGGLGPGWNWPRAGTVGRKMSKGKESRANRHATYR